MGILQTASRTVSYTIQMLHSCVGARYDEGSVISYSPPFSDECFYRELFVPDMGMPRKASAFVNSSSRSNQTPPWYEAATILPSLTQSYPAKTAALHTTSALLSPTALPKVPPADAISCLTECYRF